MSLSTPAPRPARTTSADNIGIDVLTLRPRLDVRRHARRLRHIHHELHSVQWAVVGDTMQHAVIELKHHALLHWDGQAVPGHNDLVSDLAPYGLAALVQDRAYLRVG